VADEGAEAVGTSQSSRRARLVDEPELQRQHFQSLFELSPVAIVTTDLETKVTAWNPSAESLFGYAREEALGQKIDDLIADREDLRRQAGAVRTEAERTGRFHGVTRRARKDGALVDVEVLAVAVVVDGEHVGYYAIYSDIGELQRQKRYYESLVEVSPTAIVTVDLDANITSWNPAAERLFGYTAAEAVGHNVDDLLVKDPHIRREAVAANEQAKRDQVQLVTQRNRKDGSLVDVQLLGAPIVVGDEQVGMYALYHDISELQRQRLYYESLVAVSPTAIATVDLDATVTSWNQAAERLFGYTAAEAIGRNIDELVAKDERLRAEAVAVSRRGAVGEEARLVTQRTRKDGTFVDVQVLAAPIVVGDEQVGFYALYHDISELQRQRRYYEALVASSPVAIALLDLEANVTSWNPTAEELFGYSAEEAIGRNIDDLVAATEEIRSEAKAFTQQGMSGDLVHAITRRTRKDGSLVDVEMFGAPVTVAGEPAGLYAMFHDITELQRARFEAEAATEAKSAFLATMSHEIRTPMNAVIGMTDLLLGTDLDGEQRSFVEVIRTSGEALLSVINDILDFSKIEAGRLDLDDQPFDLRDCVESALDLVARSAADKGLDLAYVLEPGTPEALVGDAGRIRQVLLNLLNNAVKFTERGEVVLSVEAQPVRAPADPAENGRYRVHVTVTDTGIGIAEDRIHGLFESFSQVDASTTRRYGGTGLGLAISKRLSEAMGGTMWVESRPGKGSAFHFTIEAASAPRPIRAYEQQRLVPLEGKRVLILDDNATNRHILRWQAESWGMFARDTESPARALDWIRSGDPFDVAILDMQMPEMDGLTVAREIRKLRDAGRLPLVLLTSLGRREEEAREALFAAYLTKPIRPSQLYDVLLGVLGEPARAGLVEEQKPLASERAASALPLRILVVEDNPVNRRLALLLLEKMGYRADVATNGVEALQALENRAYDVVLMDVQMPEMDGLEATRKIHERLASARPRIIAATATALQDERERCLAAGMDDYLSKPIRMEQLAAALAQVDARPDVQVPGSDPPAPAEAGSLHPDVLMRLRETVGDVGIAEMIDVFLAEAPALVTTLRRAIELDDAEELRRAAHTLKSNGDTFGARGLAELCRRLEEMGETASLEGAPELLTRVEAEHERVRSQLDRARRELAQ
jgi:PAS domain S-box-containing protein